MDAIVAAKGASTRLVMNERIAEVTKQAHQLMGNLWMKFWILKAGIRTSWKCLPVFGRA